jgi:hypothetical protein
MLNTMKELTAIGEKLGKVTNVSFSEKPSSDYSWDTDRVRVSGIMADGRPFSLSLTVTEPEAEDDSDAD